MLVNTKLSEGKDKKQNMVGWKSFSQVPKYNGDETSFPNLEFKLQKATSKNENSRADAILRVLVECMQSSFAARLDAAAGGG